MIANLTINNFIGIKAMSIRNEKGKNLIFYGPNGCGKSSVADAIKYLQCREHEISKVGRDRDRMLVFQGRKIEDVSVTCSLTTKGTVVRSALEASTCSDDLSRTYIDRIQILRKDNLLQFLNAVDADRYRLFLSLMSLDHLTKKIEAFQARLLAIKNAIDLNKSKTRELHNLVAFAELEGSNLAEIVEQHIANIKDNFEGYEEGDTLESLKVKFDLVVDPSAESKIKALSADEQRVLKGPTDEDLDAVKAVYRGISELIRLRSESSESGLRLLLKEAINAFQERSFESCPVCLNSAGFDQEEILEKLREREQALQKLISAEKKLTTVIEANDLERKFADWIEIDTSFFDQRFRSKLNSTKDIIDDLLRARNIPREVEYNDELDDFRDETQKKVLSIKAELKVFSSNITVFKLANEQLLNNRSAWLETETILSNLEIEREIIAKCDTAMIAARDEVIDEILTEIQTDTLDLYEKLNYGVQEFDQVKFRKLRKSSLQLGINFFDNGVVDPNSVLSTGHLDLFALALYLATVRKFYPTGTLIVLEDMITSNDNEHRTYIARVIVNELRDFRLIVTTHMQGFFSTIIEQIRHYGMSSDWVEIEFDQWDKDTGANLSKIQGSSVSPDNRMAFLKAGLTYADYLTIGGPLRIVTEGLLKRLSIKKKCSVQYKAPDSYTIGDFIVNKDLQKEIKKDLVGELDNAGTEDLMADIFAQPSLANFLSHDKELTPDVPFADVERFVLALEHFIEYEKSGIFKKLS